MNQLPDISAILATNAALFPDKVGAADSSRSLTFRQWDRRTSRLANGLLGIGLQPGDRVAVLAHNCVEWMEVYAAVARAGLVAVPVNFRLAGPEVQHIVNDSGARAMIVDAPFHALVEEIRGKLGVVPTGFICLRTPGTRPGWRDYEELIASARSTFQSAGSRGGNTWTLMYTSGTTGRPKGAIRSHQSFANFYLTNAAEFGFQRRDRALLVMPMCHVNSVFYSFVFTLMGATAIVYDRPHFDPEHLFRVLGDQRITFTSLVPTHCTMLLDLPGTIRASVNTTALRKLMVSSAPARRETKLAIMEQFPNTELYEGYGSTEAGLVTSLRPEEQLDHLGSIGREIIMSDRIRLLDDDGVEVPDGAVGRVVVPHANDIRRLLEPPGPDCSRVPRRVLHSR